MLAIGTRVEVHPATDMWMRGQRYADVVGHVQTVAGLVYRLQFDGERSGRCFHPTNIYGVVDGSDVVRYHA